MTRRRASAASAVAGAVLLVVGVPLALWLLAGDPFPSRLPGLSELGRALTRGDIDDTTIVKALALLCWAVWAQITLALGLETVAALRGRPAPRAPVIAVFQALAAAMVAAAVPVSAGLDPPRPPLPESLLVHGGADPARTPSHYGKATGGVDAPTTRAEQTAAPGGNGHRADPDSPRHVVGFRDTLWSVAESRLGDGYRWREVFELNRGRPQPDGGALARPDETLRQGWVLVLPDDARPLPGTASAPDPVASPDPVPDGTEPDVGAILRAAEAAGEMLDSAEEERRAALEILATTPPDDDPIPALPAEEPSVPPPPVIDVSEAEELAAVREMPVRTGSSLERLAGVGLLAGGLVWSLDRLRRSAERLRLPGRVPAAPSPAAAGFERSLRATARPDLVAFVDLTLRSWAVRLREAGRRPPPVVGINVAEEVSLLFGAPDPVAVAGFAVEDDGFSWVTSAARDLEALEAGGGGPPPLPAIFTIGHTERSQVLLNAEAMDVLAVTGSPSHVAGTLFAAAAELATGPWSGGVRVITIGFDDHLPLPGVKSAPSLAHVLPRLEAAADCARAARDARGVVGAADARVRGLGGPEWEPVVVVAQGLDADDAARLATLATATPGCGVAALIGGQVATARWHAAVGDGEVSLDPVGVTLRRPVITAEERVAVGELLGAVAATFEPHPSPGSLSGLRLRPRPALTPVPEAAPVEVRVLGRVEVPGAPGDFPRRKALELVAYLALHRRGVDPDTLAEALWPDRFVSTATLHTTVSFARRALGETPGGELLLPHFGTDVLYRLDPSVGVDLERFAALTRPAGNGTGEAATATIERMRQGLELVRGRPFTVPGGEYLWVHAEALVAAVVADVTDAAHRLACLYLEARDFRGAWWATQQGLLASPGNEQLHRDRMVAAELAGNPAGVEDVMEELCRAVEVDRSEIHEVLHPMTIELYERLSRRAPSRN